MLVRNGPRFARAGRARHRMQYFVVMIDYGRRGREAVVDPEITRREVISRVASGEYRNISFIHEIADCAVEDITADTIRVPGFFTYAGFQRVFIEKLPTITEQLQRDNWVLGDIGKQIAITSQYDNLGPDMLALYGMDFIAARPELWNEDIGV